MLFHVGNGLLVNREDPVLTARLDRHIRDREAIVHGQLGNAFPGKLHGLVQSAVDTDPADDVKDHVLAADIFLQLSGKIDPDRGGHLEPGLAGHAAGCHIRGADTCGERAEGTVGTGM